MRQARSRSSHFARKPLKLLARQCRGSEIRHTICRESFGRISEPNDARPLSLLVSCESEVRIQGCCKVFANFGFGTPSARVRYAAIARKNCGFREPDRVPRLFRG